MTERILFMCPHSAGKSLFAATYFRAAAARSGLDVNIEVAGTGPGPHNMTSAQTALEQQGYTIDWHPRLVTEADTDAADLIISVDCEHDTIPTDKAHHRMGRPSPQRRLPSIHASHPHQRRRTLDEPQKTTQLTKPQDDGR